MTITDAGFAPVLSNDSATFLDGTGNWTIPAGGGGGGNVVAGPQFVLGDLVEVTGVSPPTIQSNGIDSDRVVQMPTPADPTAGALIFWRGSDQVIESARIGNYALGATPSDDTFNLANVDALNGDFTGTLSENGNRVYSAGNPPPGLAGTINTIRLNSGADVSTNRARLNFIEGAGVTISIVDDAVGDEADITIQAAAGGGDVVQGGTGLDQDVTFWSNWAGREIDGITLADGGMLSKQPGSVAAVPAGTTGHPLVAGAAGAAPSFQQLVSASYGANSISNLALNDVGTGTLKGRATAGTGDPEDFTILSLTTNGNNTGFLLGTDQFGSGLQKIDIAPLAAGGATTFEALTDTPANYTGAAGQTVVVNGTEDGLIFTTPAGGGDMLSPVAAVTVGELYAAGTTDGTQTAGTGIQASDVVQGPTIAVNSNVATFNGTTGRVIQDESIPSAQLARLDQAVDFQSTLSEQGVGAVYQAAAAAETTSWTPTLSPGTSPRRYTNDATPLTVNLPTGDGDAVLDLGPLAALSINGGYTVMGSRAAGKSQVCYVARDSTNTRTIFVYGSAEA